MTHTTTETRGCPSWCAGDHADDGPTDRFHDGTPHRIELGDRELVFQLTAASSADADNDAWGVGVFVEVLRPGSSPGDGDLLGLAEIDELVEVLQTMQVQARSVWGKPHDPRAPK